MSAPASTALAGATTEGCRYCWMCRQACPVGLVTSRETFTPHAWALTIESVRRGQLQWNPETVDVLYTCADCGLCQAHCATDQPLPMAIAGARADVVAAGAAPAAVLDIDRKLQTNASLYATTRPVRATGTGQVALFVGDAAQALRPGTVDAALALLSAAGISAVPIAAGRSTGSVACSLGLRATAVKLAEAVLADVAAAGCREVLVLSPGDRWAFEHVYGDRLGLGWPSGVAIREVVACLDEAVASGQLRLKTSGDAPAYAYHDPCHAPRLARDADAPRRLLAAALGANGARQLFWRGGRAHPCGAVGGLELTQPKVAAALAAARFADSAAAGAKWLVTEDPTCLDHLSRLTAHGIEVQGLFELLVGRL